MKVRRVLHSLAASQWVMSESLASRWRVCTVSNLVSLPRNCTNRSLICNQTGTTFIFLGRGRLQTKLTHTLIPDRIPPLRTTTVNHVVGTSAHSCFGLIANPTRYCQLPSSPSEQHIEDLQSPAPIGLACVTMTNLNDTSSANGDSDDQTRESSSLKQDKILRSSGEVKIPTGPSADILAYAFANLGQYDENKPVSCSPICDQILPCPSARSCLKRRSLTVAPR
jgi:hypothetical protein